MKVTFIGQSGLIFEKDGYRIIVDPYLSDSVEKIQPANYRRVGINKDIFDLKTDMMIFTHCHLDHYDPETAGVFLSKNRGMTVLSPSSVWGEVRKHCGHNFVLFDRHTRWTEEGITVTAVKAAHSDSYAIGVIIDDGEKKYYVTGDTLYSEDIFPDIPKDIYALFLPVNGAGNNMNMTDAAAFAKRIGAKRVVPTHIGMFDELTADGFDCENKVVAEIYKEIKL